MVLNVVVVVVALVMAGLLAFAPALRTSSAWRATVTPLASIMGSGFLVSAPLVASVAGLYAPLAMAALLATSYGIGALIRFNIRYAEGELASDDGDDGDEHSNHDSHQQATAGHWYTRDRRVAHRLEQVSHVVLTGAYTITVSYYLQLLAAFVLDRAGVSSELVARGLTTGVIALIATVGTVWGLRALEKVETYAVSLNLGMISALLVALLIHDGSAFAAGTLALPDLAPSDDLWHTARVTMGLLIVVQGFETSRFLGADHAKDERIRTMRWAQWIATGVYLLFVTLMLPLLNPDLSAEVTAVLELVQPVATVLPIAILVAAVGSQFSAAVADDAGCAGLVQTITDGRLSPRLSYVLIGGAAVALTWLTDVNAVISLASRAFALFYALQASVAVLTALGNHEVRHRTPVIVGGVLMTLLALAVAVLGIPAE